MTSEKGMYTFAYGNNVIAFLLYTFWALCIPLLVVRIKDKVRAMV